MISPSGSTIGSNDQITLSCATSGATIKYYFNDDASQTYTYYASPPVYPVDDNTGKCKITAWAEKSGMENSETASRTWTINYPTIAAPTISRDGGVISAATDVTITPVTTGSHAAYRIGSTTVVADNADEALRVTITETTDLVYWAQADFDGTTVKSAENTAHFTFSTGEVYTRVSEIATNTPYLVVGPNGTTPKDVMTQTINTKNGYFESQSTGVTFDNTNYTAIVTDSSNLAIIEFEDADDGNYFVKLGDQYINIDSKGNPSLSATGQAVTVSYVNPGFSLKFSNDYILQYNASSPRFKGYTSAQSKVWLYAGESVERPDAPTISHPSQAFARKINVVVKPVTEGSAVAYKLNDGEVVTATADQAVIIPIEATTTVEAWTVKDGVSSSKANNVVRQFTLAAAVNTDSYRKASAVEQGKEYIAAVGNKAMGAYSSQSLAAVAVAPTLNGDKITTTDALVVKFEAAGDDQVYLAVGDQWIAGYADRYNVKLADEPVAAEIALESGAWTVRFAEGKELRYVASADAFNTVAATDGTALTLFERYTPATVVYKPAQAIVAGQDYVIVRPAVGTDAAAIAAAYDATNTRYTTATDGFSFDGEGLLSVTNDEIPTFRFVYDAATGTFQLRQGDLTVNPGTGSSHVDLAADATDALTIAFGENGVAELKYATDGRYLRMTTGRMGAYDGTNASAINPALYVANAAEYVKAAKPTYSITTVTFLDPIQPVISTDTPGATIHYTIEGGDEQVGVAGQDVTLNITESTTVRAWATHPCYLPSDVAEMSYSHIASGEKFILARSIQSGMRYVMVGRDNDGNNPRLVTNTVDSNGMLATTDEGFAIDEAARTLSIGDPETTGYIMFDRTETGVGMYITTLNINGEVKTKQYFEGTNIDNKHSLEWRDTQTTSNIDDVDGEDGRFAIDFGSYFKANCLRYNTEDHTIGLFKDNDENPALNRIYLYVENKLRAPILYDETVTVNGHSYQVYRGHVTRLVPSYTGSTAHYFVSDDPAAEPVAAPERSTDDAVNGIVVEGLGRDCYLTIWSTKDDEVSAKPQYHITQFLPVPYRRIAQSESINTAKDYIFYGGSGETYGVMGYFEDGTNTQDHCALVTMRDNTFDMTTEESNQYKAVKIFPIQACAQVINFEKLNTASGAPSRAADVSGQDLYFLKSKRVGKYLSPIADGNNTMGYSDAATSVATVDIDENGIATIEFKYYLDENNEWQAWDASKQSTVLGVNTSAGRFSLYKKSAIESQSNSATFKPSIYMQSTPELEFYYKNHKLDTDNADAPHIMRRGSEVEVIAWGGKLHVEGKYNRDADQHTVDDDVAIDNADNLWDSYTLVVDDDIHFKANVKETEEDAYDEALLQEIHFTIGTITEPSPIHSDNHCTFAEGTAADSWTYKTENIASGTKFVTITHESLAGSSAAPRHRAAAVTIPEDTNVKIVAEVEFQGNDFVYQDEEGNYRYKTERVTSEGEDLKVPIHAPVNIIVAHTEADGYRTSPDIVVHAGYQGGVTGLENINSDFSADSEYYNLQGMKISSRPAPGQVVIERRGATVRRVLVQ